jgi:hypothetical protein
LCDHLPYIEVVPADCDEIEWSAGTTCVTIGYYVDMVPADCAEIEWSAGTTSVTIGYYVDMVPADQAEIEWSAGTTSVTICSSLKWYRPTVLKLIGRPVPLV